MAGIQLVGNGGTVAEVDAAFRAARVTTRPMEVGSLGSYGLGGVSGVMAAGLGAAAPIFSFRWGNANIALVRSIFMTLSVATAFATGVSQWNLVVARSFTVSDSAGTNLTPTSNSSKFRTSFGTTLLTDARISTTATLTAGTRTLDGTDINTLSLNSTQANQQIFQKVPLLDRDGDQWPLVLAQNEGFIIRATVAGTGTWTFSVNVRWDEVASF
jgi:hypothetical protein